ncbi:MAG: flavin reductase family protein [Deltaproteobacteria bacterium]|nr:flavin reductase family protein [Deltaproteobacteria bacterium]
MAKTRIAPALFTPPMPVSLVGAQVGGVANFMTVAWLTRVNFDPPMLAVALGSGHHTPSGIRENKTFSVCLPGAGLVEKTDYCGLVSGKRVDKSGVFDVFYGDLETAPMIAECPLCVECVVAQIVELPTNLLVIGNIAGVYADDSILTDGKPDAAKLAPLVLTMPDNHYWKLGEVAGRAWEAGKALKK